MRAAAVLEALAAGDLQALKADGRIIRAERTAQLAIGRALVTRSRLLTLDEPTEGIQSSIIEDIDRAIAYLRSRGDMAIVLVEQYFDIARELADRFYVLDRGEVAASGPAADLDAPEMRRLLTV